MLSILVKHYLLVRLKVSFPSHSAIGDDHVFTVASLEVERLVHERLQLVRRRRSGVLDFKIFCLLKHLIQFVLATAFSKLALV